jgi:hypothetical protein
MQSAAHMIQVREPEPITKEERYHPTRWTQGDLKLLTMREMPINEERCQV